MSMIAYEAAGLRAHEIFSERVLDTRMEWCFEDVKGAPEQWHRCTVREMLADNPNDYLNAAVVEMLHVGGCVVGGGAAPVCKWRLAQ